MASRAEKLRRRQHRKDKKRRQRRLLWSESPPSEDLLVVDPPGGAKMSAALMTLVEPEWHDCQNDEAMRKLLTLGMAAWNAALMQGAKRTAFLDALAEKFPPELRQDFMEIIEPFIRRKDELFPHIQRPMLNYELTWRAGKAYVVVLSGMA